MTDGASFLPRIESVFYAVFDVQQGPKIVHQVPEGLIAVRPITAAQGLTGASLLTVSPSLRSETESSSSISSISRASSTVHSPATISRADSGKHPPSPQKHGDPTSRFLFTFDDVSKYIIPHSALCGRLVICATRNHRIIGFPVEIRAPDKYERNYFRYNLCFVFERHADLSCYEPVVRKVSRVLTTCEEESAFLTSPGNSQTIYAILEQLYEDLNSYSETSIPIDQFNSIELKIFPFYPNPPAVKDWDIPLALISLTRRVEDNWDLTIVKVCQYIDGVNHVSRIAQLAECDLDLTREAVAHLLYYQVIMMIDVFQFSNMYILRKNIQWLAEEHHVKEECGPYVTRHGCDVPIWPDLLFLYSKMRPGKTVLEWMNEYNVPQRGIDVRRFTTFGVVKGFLRRVHRWPVLLPGETRPQEDQPYDSQGYRRPRERNQAFSNLSAKPIGTTVHSEPDQARVRGRLQEAQPTITSAGAELVATRAIDSSHPIRRFSAAELSLEQLRSRSREPPPSSQPKFGGSERNSIVRVANRVLRSGSTISNPPEAIRRQYQDGNSFHPSMSNLIASSPQFNALKLSPDVVNSLDMVDSENSSGGTLGVTRPKLSRSPSAPISHIPHTAAPFPPDLLPLLDGEHHTDELCTKFHVGWPMLEQWLVMAGGGQGDGDYGDVAIIIR
ncbi:nitrogen permease regulator 2-domain-containing protein [Abortiporus biennis]|nr:nitrogen permease regulator 2-domain-containing protein [Abortiporus biennis]